MKDVKPRVNWEVSIGHPSFGFLRSEPEFWSAGDDKYIAGFWGPYWIYANLPLGEVEFWNPQK